MSVPQVQILTCRQCGMDWTRPRVRGAVPGRCPDCRVTAIPNPRRGGGGSPLDTNTAGYRLALAITSYRLAIEEATCALRLGRGAEALAALERVQAPTRRADTKKNHTDRSAA